MANRTQETSAQQNRKPSSAGTGTQGNGGMQAASDHLYPVVSVLYHALQGSQAYQQYIEDARNAEAPAIEQFFQDCQKEENMRAQRAKSLLFDLLEDEEDEDEDESDSEDEDEDDK